jgi:hypothetical protein
LGQTFERNGVLLRLRVRLTPGARSEQVGGIFLDADGLAWLKASVRAVPEKGKANQALVEMLSRNTGIARSRFLIASGEAARFKTVHISPADGADEAALALLERG